MTIKTDDAASAPPIGNKSVMVIQKSYQPVYHIC